MIPIIQTLAPQNTPYSILALYLFLTNNKRWIFKWKACCTKQAIARKFDAEELQMYRGIVTWDSYEEELILIVK